MNDEARITIRLTVAEFVVLDELLRRFSRSDQLTIDDASERQALWNLQCICERLPDRSDSWPSLEEARASLRAGT